MGFARGMEFRRTRWARAGRRQRGCEQCADRYSTGLLLETKPDCAAGQAWRVARGFVTSVAGWEGRSLRYYHVLPQ
jgi:hypothetical protein